MTKILEAFFMDGDTKIMTGELVKVRSFRFSDLPRSGIYVNAFFPDRGIELEMDSRFVFTEKEVEILRNTEKGEKFFENFINGNNYGI